MKHLLKVIFVLFATLSMQVFSAKESTNTNDKVVADVVAKKTETKIPNIINETREWSEFFDESLDDLKEEKEVAKEEDKKAILVMFEMDECPFCARMKRTVLNKSQVQDYFRENFRILSVDTEGDLELTDFKGKTTTQKNFSLKQNRVRATPVFQFFDLKGTPLKNGRLTGVTRNADEFLLLGKYIAEGHNEKLSFSKYKRAHKNQTKQ